MLKSKSGFTIVELLIVIVVVAILAAISIVSYNGVQNRAKISSEQSDLNVLAKAVSLYKANGGSMTDGVAGAATGKWYGGGSTTYPGTPKSMRQALQDSGYLPSSFSRNFMLSSCTTIDNETRVVMLKTDAVIDKTPAEQLDTDCSAGAGFSLYTDPSHTYKMNLVKLVN